MATKSTKATEAAATSDDLYAGYTEEEKAELLALTGQNANLKGEKTPILKVNYCDLEDVNGNSVKKGNFVFNQNSKEASDGDDIKVENIGVDLGKATEITILAYRQQYAFYSDDASQRCSSQIFGNGETPVGNTLKYECRAKTCPRRAEGIDKKDRCVCQYVVMAKVKIGDEYKPAMMYVKGKSFIQFSEYLKKAGAFPLFFAPTRLTNKMEKQGSVTYFVTNFELLTDSPFAQIEQRENVAAVKNAVKTLEDSKKANQVKQIGATSGTAATATVVDKATKIKAQIADVEDYNDDDIEF